MQRFSTNGYEVIVGESEISFLDRKTWGLSVLMIILGCCGVLLAFLSALWFVAGVSDTKMEFSETLGVAFPVGAVVLLVGVWIISRTYRARRTRPIEEIPDTLILDRLTQVLRNRTGDILIQMADVKARMHIDWWTRGAMRIVVLSWPGGRRTIYRALGRRGSLELLAFLNEQGLDAQ